jgi:hypothetical protein
MVCDGVVGGFDLAIGVEALPVQKINCALVQYPVT